MKITFLLFLLFCYNSVFAHQDPLLFIENKGQVTDQHYQPRTDIDFMLRSGGLNVFIGSGQIHYLFRKVDSDPSATPDRHELVKRKVYMHRLDVELVGANINARFEKQQPNDYYEQYYSPLFDDKGALAHSYQRLVYRDVYPHIDWVLFINEDKLEYEFVVKEGGDVQDIKLKYSGADGLKLKEDGSLLCSTSLGEISEHKPYCYTNDKEVASEYKLQNNILTFNVGSYSGQLIIDPTVEWIYNCCGNDYQATGGVATDAQGNVYITGGTMGGSVATTGAYQSTLAGMEDGFVIKLDDQGTKLWGTYFGGPDVDHPTDIDFDNIGAMYVYGSTTSTTGIASIGAHQTTYSGPALNDKGIFLAKFSLAGSREWSTYYGHGYMDWGSVACDQSGNVYMVGGTNDGVSVATPGAHQSTKAGLYDGFMVKFNTSGVRQWGTYYGGDAASGDESLRGIYIDNSDNVYVSGFCRSTNNVATSGSFQSNYEAGIIPDAHNGVLAKFDNNGVRQWGTYYRKSLVNSVTCDNSGNVFIAGTTADVTNISTSGAHQAIYAGGSNYGDIFIARFDANGNRQWGSYLGGSQDDALENIRMSPDGFIYIMGYSKSTSGVASANAYKPTYQGGTHDGLFAKFASNGMCMWSSYYGTNSSDACYDIMPISNTGFYMCGLNPLGSGTDGFLVKFQDNSSGVATVLNNKNIMSVYPNPNAGQFTLACAEWDDDISLTISDALGRVVFKEVYQANATIDIDMSQDLKPGVYFIHVTNGMKNYNTVLIYR